MKPPKPSTVLDCLLTKLTAKVVIVLDSDAYRDAVKLYKELNNTKLHNRVLLVKMPDGFDISDVYQKLGKKGIIRILKNAGKIKESML